MSRRVLAIQFTEDEVAELDAFCDEYPRNHNGLRVPRAAVIRMLVRLGWDTLRANDGAELSPPYHALRTLAPTKGAP